MQIVSNFHTRFFIPGYDVPAEIHHEYDHLDLLQRADHWIRYMGTWSHVSDFLPLTGNRWTGYTAGTYFSGLVIRINDDGESYRIGRWIV